ncbi:MAG: DUF3102 domain-containing protein [Oscillospiraceae bacterium]|nr:DUF3102 domain-containing protein [Oscillospiraceae bacterium]
MTELAVTVRPLPVIEAELDFLEKDTRQKETALIENYIEVGRRLEEVKAQLPHGEWGPWLENRGYAQAKAVKLMKVFRAYGKEQQSLFGGEAKSQAFANLGFQKLVQLLAIEDGGEREQFVAEHNVERMSTRELDKALKEREKALEEAEAAKAEADTLRLEAEHLQTYMDEQARTYEKNLTSMAAEAEQSKLSAKHWQEAWENANQDLDAAKSAAAAAEAEHTRLLQELEELRNRPVDVAVEVDTKAVEAAREAAVAEMSEKVDKAKAAKKKADAARKAAEDALATAKKKLAVLEAREPQVRELTPEEKAALTADAVERARAEDLERVRELEKQLASADGDTASFKVFFEAWQDNYWKMKECLNRIAERDLEKSGKLQDAVQAAVERMGM